MSLIKTLVVFALVGLIIPIVWLFLYKMGLIHLIINDGNEQVIMNVLILLWPSSILLIADPMDNNYLLQFVSVIINPILYIMVGIAFLKVKKYLENKK